MLLPLGLFLKFPRIPFITILIIVLNCYVYFFHGEYRSDGLIIDSFQKNDAYINTRARFFTEYCYKQSYELEVCENVKLILSVAHKKNSSLDSVSTKFLLDSSFLEASQLIGEIQNEIERDIYADDFKVLDSFTDYLVFHEELKELLKSRAKRYTLLTPEYLSVKSLFLAMFRHANLAHLFGNLFILFVFGVYVEFRMRPEHYIGLYILSGFLGLMLHALIHLESGMSLMGASANVFGVMGAFYFFFRPYKFKVFVFYLFSKVISVPIKYWFFVFFFLLEFINIFAKSNVAHGAHIYGMLVGMLCCLLYKKKYPLAQNFVFPYEVEKYQEIKQTENLNIKLIRAKSLLEHNPYNDELRSYIFNEIFEEASHDKGILLEKSDFLEGQLPIYLKKVYEKQGLVQLIQILNNMPDIINFTMLLEPFRYKELVSIIDHCIAQKYLYTAIRVIGVVFSEYKNHRQITNFERTMESIMQHFNLNLDQSIYLLKYSQNKRFDKIIKDYVDHGELHG